MILQERIELLCRLGQYMMGESEDWQAVKERAYRENPWFVPEFIEQSVRNIALNFLNTTFLQEWAARYGVPVISSEIVGLTPVDALLDVAEYYLQLENFKKEQVLEKRLLWLLNI